jgi:hypothetical protein
VRDDDPLDTRRSTADNRGVRVWVAIALVCIGGTAAGRDSERKAGRKPAASPPAAVAPAEPPGPSARRSRCDFGDCDTDRCWTLCSCGSCDRGRYHDAPLPTAAELATTPLTGGEVVDGFRAVERTVQECRPANARPDPIPVHAAIAKDGKVSAVTVQGKLAPMAATCIENAVKAAHFRASSGLAADYVFLYRRFESRAVPGARDGGVDGRDGSADTGGQ